jgi:hypothetical protein
MRYRSINTIEEHLTQDYNELLNLVGKDIYRKMLSDIGRGLNFKGYVTPFDDTAFQLELKLFNVDLHFLQGGEKFTSLPRALHEAVDFIIGLGQTIPYLPAGGKNRLRGQIVGA